MKATIVNLRKALKECAKAHGVRYESWGADGQIGIKSESVPVQADVRMICEAFYGASEMVEAGWGYTTIFLYDFMNDKTRDVEEVLLGLALPYKN